jgi:hypothetical protein
MAANSPPGASALILKPRTDWSFELVSGSPAHLATWLESFGYYRRPLRNSAIEAYRNEGAVVGDQLAFVTTFKSGVVVVMGSAQAREQATCLLQRLCVGGIDEPIGEQAQFDFEGAC